MTKSDIELRFVELEYEAIKADGKMIRFDLGDLTDTETDAALIGPDNSQLSDDGIRHIVEAFVKAKKDQTSQPEPFQIGGMWERIIARVYKEMLDNIAKGDIAAIKSILSNFGTNPISKGLSLSGGLPETLVEKLRWLNMMNQIHYLWMRMTNLPEAVLEYPLDVGNMFGCKSNGNVIIQPAYRLSYMADRLQTLITGKEHPVIVEIGGGFGGIPYHIFKNNPGKCTYINFDIPEVCLISKYFLKTVFPDKKFLFYGDAKIGDVNILNYDIVIMPNYAIRELPDQCCDVVFNSHSLVEMNYSTVREYLIHINRLSRKFFLHANHEQKVEYASRKGRKKFVDLNLPEFQLPTENFKQVYRIPESLMNHSPNTSYYGEFYEYLYKRIN